MPDLKIISIFWRRPGKCLFSGLAAVFIELVYFFRKELVSLLTKAPRRY